MYRGLQIGVPFFEVGPKAFLYGKELLRLAKFADFLCEKHQVSIIFTPQYVDIPILANETNNILVFAQHMDAIGPGRGVGAVLPEALKDAGADGVLLNHFEKRLPLSELEKIIDRANTVGLATMVCADSKEDAAIVARLSPNIIIAEPPELIGVGTRSADHQKAIMEINRLVWEINSEILVLHGAGISTGQDVYDVIAAGAQATGSTSGIFLSNDPYRILEEMIVAVHDAWTATHTLTSQRRNQNGSLL